MQISYARVKLVAVQIVWCCCAHCAGGRQICCVQKSLFLRVSMYATVRKEGIVCVPRNAQRSRLGFNAKPLPHGMLRQVHPEAPCAYVKSNWTSLRRYCDWLLAFNAVGGYVLFRTLSNYVLVEGAFYARQDMCCSS
jgi:hypothetical protein